MSKNEQPFLLDNNESKSYYFEGKTEFIIGRSTDSSLDIASKFISRKQCLIKYTNEKQWVIQDLSSFKTTKVNGKATSIEGQILNNGDKISFINLPEKELIFYKYPNVAHSAKKRKTSLQTVDISYDNVHSSQEIDDLKKKNSALLAEGAKLADENKILNEKYQQVSKILEQTQLTLDNLETEKTSLALKLMEEEAVKERLILRIEGYVEQLEECESELCRVVQEKNSLKDFIEKGTGISNKSSHIEGQEGTLFEDRAHQFDINPLFDAVEFNSMKENIESMRKELLTKDGCLNEVLAEKSIFTNNISDLIEQEFSCSVCSEILCQATTLDCRHTFCAKCVATWKQKKRDCPVCRTKMKFIVMPLVIDSFLDKLADLIGEDFKKRRVDLKIERQTTHLRGGTVTAYRTPRGSRRAGGNSRGRRSSRGLHFRHTDNLIEEYESLVSHMQGLIDSADSLITVDLTSL